MDPKRIARVVHEANRALTVLLLDVPIQPHFDDAPDEMIRSSIQGVVWRLNNRAAPASAQHEEWCRAKIADGWRWGPQKDAEKKEHPALIPYCDLPDGSKVKDTLFSAIVLALADS